MEASDRDPFKARVADFANVLERDADGRFELGGQGEDLTHLVEQDHREVVGQAAGESAEAPVKALLLTFELHAREKRKKRMDAEGHDPVEARGLQKLCVLWRNAHVGCKRGGIAAVALMGRRVVGERVQSRCKWNQLRIDGWVVRRCRWL